MVDFLFPFLLESDPTHTHTHTTQKKKKKKQTNHQDESRINLLLNGECLGRDV